MLTTSAKQQLTLNRIKQLDDELKKSFPNKDLINSLQLALSNDITNASSLEEFYNLPITNIFNIIKKVDFSIQDDYYGLLKTIIKNASKKHGDAVCLLDAFICEYCDLALNEIIDILKCFEHSQLLIKLGQLYDESEKLVDIDFEFELEAKEKKIEELKENTDDIDTPVTTQPKNFEPNIFHAVITGKLSSVKYLVGMNPELVNKTAHGSKNTPLHHACLNGHLSIVKYLIKNGADINVTNKNEKSPTFYAVQKGYLHIIEYLFDLNVIGKNILLSDSIYLLNIACSYEQFEIAKYLIEKQNYDVNLKDPKGNTPLLIACKKDSFEIANYLINCRNIVIDTRNNKGNNALHLACSKCCEKIVDLLLATNKININAKNNKGKTPLHIIATQSELPAYTIARKLILCGAEKTEYDNMHRIPYQLAVRSDVQILLLF